MNKKARIISEQALIILSIFTLFLLIFDDRLVLPYWLQPLGRMHPMFLHFPIVLMILATTFEVYRVSISGTNDKSYRNISRSLLLIGTLLAGITAILGLFLSREEGYGGTALQWHKWSGAAIFFLGSCVYWAGSFTIKNRLIAWSGALGILAALFIAGHYGSILTHGDNFILQPVLANLQHEPVPLEQAVLFRDVIEPVLEKKCTGCHNPHKLKGEMDLTDSVAILKGGKTGKLFVPGNPEISLLLERIHLPQDEEKHMPPAGKAQLTAEEMNLLALWIKEDAGFNSKVLAFPIQDSLRLIATDILHPTVDSSELYDFPPADTKRIATLNSDYRTVRQIARESPALEVNIFNKEAWSSKLIQELEPVRKQIVSLSLNKLPVTNEDLKAIAKLENLRRLELNFTEISDEGLANLGGLKNLKNLTISGTAISLAGLRNMLDKLGKLSSVAIWNTRVTGAEIISLQQAHKKINFIGGFVNDGKDPLKLNPPQVKNTSTVFSDSLLVRLGHPVRGVEIRFTTNGSDPDSLHSPIFDNTLSIRDNTTIKAKAYKSGWYSSEVVTFDFFKNSFIPDSVQLLEPLNSVHQAEGAHTFFNRRLGVIGANNPAWANYWAGVRNNDLVLISVFNQPVKIGSVGLHYMVEEATGIYPPASVEVWGGLDEHRLRLLTTIRSLMPKKGEKPSLKIATSKFAPSQLTYLKIIAKPHAQKKDKHLLLVDEMFLN